LLEICIIKCIMKKTSLFDIHVKLNAKMVPFAGFNMPVQFEGVNAEHLKVRSSVGIFDVEVQLVYLMFLIWENF